MMKKKVTVGLRHPEESFCLKRDFFAEMDPGNKSAHYPVMPLKKGEKICIKWTMMIVSYYSLM